MNPYRHAAQMQASKYYMTLGQWTKGYTWETAIESVEGGYKSSDDAALWMWYQVGRKAGERLTVNASEVKGDIMTWKRAAKYVRALGCYPDVYSTAHPYQLVLT